MLDLSKTKTIILDLGGVIINIEPQIAFQNFAALANISLSSVMDLFKSEDIFHKHEIGELSDENFYKILQEKLDIADLNQIKGAWNSLLLDIPKERIDLIIELRKSYKLILLSNTNSIHIEFINNYLLDIYNTSLDQLFDDVYLSHLINLRKPQKEIYEHVIHHSNIAASSSIFIDDVFVNANSATLVGINGYHLDLTKSTLVDLLSNNK